MYYLAGIMWLCSCVFSLRKRRRAAASSSFSPEPQPRRSPALRRPCLRRTSRPVTAAPGPAHRERDAGGDGDGAAAQKVWIAGAELLCVSSGATGLLLLSLAVRPEPKPLSRERWVPLTTSSKHTNIKTQETLKHTTGDVNIGCTSVKTTTALVMSIII